MNRFVWDLRYLRPPALRSEYSIAAAYGEDTPLLPEGPLVLPGSYQVKLTVEGHSYTAPLEVKMDPRVVVKPEALRKQLDLELGISQALTESYRAARQIQDLRRQLQGLRERMTNDPRGRVVTEAAGALDLKIAALVGGSQPAEGAAVNLTTLNLGLASLMTRVSGADTAPTEQAAAAFGDYRQALDARLAAWAAVRSKDLSELNTALQQRQLPPIIITD
jgi:hypothetical protein